MAKDLRTFINQVLKTQPEGIRRVTRKVSPQFEISALAEDPDMCNTLDPNKGEGPAA